MSGVWTSDFGLFDADSWVLCFMFEWLRATAQWLQHFIVSMPFYVAGPAMIVIGALDSSLLSLPEINDYLVVARCYSDPKAVFYFPLFAALGSVIGCLILYSIVRRGGQAVLRRRFKREQIERVERAYARFGFLALAIPAMLPPPMPFKVFVATAGALEYPRWRFAITVMIARSVRYYAAGILAIFYGEHVLDFMKDNGLVILSVVAALCVAALGIYLLYNRRRRAALRKTGSSSVTTAKAVDSAGGAGRVAPASTKGFAPTGKE